MASQYDVGATFRVDGTPVRGRLGWKLGWKLAVVLEMQWAHTALVHKYPGPVWYPPYMDVFLFSFFCSTPQQAYWHVHRRTHVPTHAHNTMLN
jgi:hypothetical protein